MKNKRKITALIATLVLVCGLMAACGSDSSDDPVVGTWEMTKVSAAGQDMSVSEFLKAANFDESEVPVITFNGDNTIDVDMLGSEGSGKWELQDGKYHISDDSSMTLDFTLENDVLSVEYSGATLEFAKQ